MVLSEERNGVEAVGSYKQVFSLYLYEQIDLLVSHRYIRAFGSHNFLPDNFVDFLLSTSL